MAVLSIIEARLSGRGRVGVILAGVASLAWTAAVRLPYAGNLGEDEAFYALVAQRWLAGAMPYRGSFDVKPPGLFAVFALAQAGFGTSIGTLKGVEVVGAGVAAWGLFLIGARHVSRPVGWFAALLYPLYSLGMSGVNAPTELIKAPFEVFGVLALLEGLRGGRGAALVAGVLLGAAGCVKQTAGFVAVALLGPLPWLVPVRLGLVVRYGMGLAVVPLTFLAMFLAAGHGQALLDGALFGAAGRLGGDNVGFGAGILRFFPGMEPLLPLLVPCLLLATRWGRLRAAGVGGVAAVLVAWFAGAAGGIMATRAMYDHYFLALLPPAALLCGAVLWHGVQLRGAMGVALLLLVAAYPVALDPRGMGRGVDLVAARAAAAALVQAGVGPGDTTIIVDRGLIIDVLAGVQPASRYFHPQHLLCDFPAPDADPLAVALAARPGAVVVAGDGRRIICGRTDRWAALRAALAASYCRVAHVEGPEDGFDVYRRSEGVCPRGPAVD